LEDLNLQVNQISVIDADAFQGLDNVGTIEIGWNSISSLTADHFRGLVNLQYLSCRSNQITSLSPNTFQGLNSLLSLNLRDNQISSLDLTGFEATALTLFDIDTNPIADVVLTDAILSQITFNTLMRGHDSASSYDGIAELAGIGSVDLSGADLSGIDQFDEMFGMADLETLILTDVVFSNAVITAGYTEVWDLISALEAQQLDALTVNEQLYAAMQTNLDAWDTGADNVLTVVPEPATLSLLVLGGLALLRRKRSYGG